MVSFDKCEMANRHFFRLAAGESDISYVATGLRAHHEEKQLVKVFGAMKRKLFWRMCRIILTIFDGGRIGGSRATLMKAESKHHSPL
jgi:hypothetical protein